MIRIKYLIALVVTGLAMSLLATTATVDGITWTYTVSNGAATVGGGSSSSTAIATSTSGAITVPSTLGGVPVTGIAQYAFNNCANLVKVVIPNGITHIDQYAFSGCGALEEITLPESLKTIGYRGFKYCYALRRVDVASIASWCNIEFDSPASQPFCDGTADCMLYIDDIPQMEIVIPDGVKRLNNYAFRLYQKLTHISIPSSVTNIGTAAFLECSGLKSVTLPQIVCNSGFAATFPNSCASVTNTVISEGVTNICDSAFHDCVGLVRLVIPNSVTSIGSCAFQGCTNLVDITIPPDVNIGYKAFDGCPVEGEICHESGQTPIETGDGISWTYTIRNGEAIVGGGTSSSTAIATSTSGKITIPHILGGAPVTEIARYAFAGCDKLTDVTIPESITRISGYAFDRCSGLKSISVPCSVTNIEKDAFCRCSGLESMELPFVGVSQSPANTWESFFSIIFGSLTNGQASEAGMKKNIHYYSTGGYVTYTRPPNLKRIVITNTRYIRYSAFSNCDSLQDVVFSNCVEYVDSTAFTNCFNIYRVTAPAKICSCEWYDRLSLKDCFPNAYKSISEVIVNEGASTISSYAFVGCESLTNIVIPASVNQIADSAFADSAKLRSVRFDGDAPEIADNAFVKSWQCTFFVGLNSMGWDVDIPGKWRGINIDYITPVLIFSANGGFCSEDLLIAENGIVPSVLPLPTRNGYYFEGWYTAINGGSEILPGAKLSKSVRLYAHWRPMSYKVSLNPNGGCLADDQMFYEVVFDSPYGAMPEPTLSGRRFNGWMLDDRVITSKTVVSTASDHILIARWKPIWDIGINDDMTAVITDYNYDLPVEVVEIPAMIEGVSVSAIGEGVFAGRTDIGTIIIPDGLTRIGALAFAGCTGLNDIVVPNSVTNIGQGCFSQCTNLVSISLPFVGAKRGNSGTKDSIFGHIFGTSSYVGGTATKQYYSSSSYSTYYIPSSLRSVVLTDEPVLGFGAFYGCSGLTEIMIPDGVTRIGSNAFNGCGGMLNIQIPNSVVSIGERAFVGCRGLSSVTIPDSVTSIGERAFAECANLESMTLPFVGAARGVETGLGSVFGHVWGIVNFQGGTNAVFTYLTGNGTDTATISCYLPESLKSVVITDESVVARGAFEQCSCLTNIVLNESVTAVGDCAFNGCSGLTRVTIPDGVEYIGEHAFDGCGGLLYGEDGFIIVNGWVIGCSNPEVTSLVIPDGVIGIGGSAFADFWDIEEVLFPDSLKYITGGAFDTCTGLDGVVIPDGVQTIGNGAFRNCTYMRDITIGESVTSIGDEAFAGCTQLSSLSIPDNVTEIGDAAFSNCWRMLSVRLPLGLESVGVNMFSGCTSLTGVTTPTHTFTMNRIFGDRYAALASVSVSSGETKVCDGAFDGCSALTSVIMPNAITNIGNSAFASCPHLAGLELPESLDVIGTGAFSNCTALAAIVLPDGVTAIGQRAFYGCTSLANVTLSRSLASIPDYAFHGCSKLNSMVVPASVGSLGAYIGNYFSSLYYLGNAPSYDANVYASRSRTITTYVVQGSRGWDGIPSSRDLPTSWNGYDITFWEPNRFNATFDANGGAFFDGSTAYACEQITDTGYALPPYEPTLEGFVFDGWWSDPYEGAQIKASVRVNETRDITFYAHWAGKPSSITVRFNPNGGTVEPDEGQYYSTLTYETLPVPTREHYKFAGWWTKAVGGNKIVASSRVPAADQELFAHWTPETYTIRYNANGGTGSMADQSFVYGSAVVLRANAFSKADKNFVGWAVAADGAVVYPDGGSLGSVAAIENGVINLYAVWRGDSYAVRFDSNGGIGSMDNATFEMDEQRALPACTFTRDGFDFAGWATSPDGEPVYSDRAVVSALTSEVNGSFVLYAVWRAFTVEVPVVTPGDGSVFVGDSCEVSITCATVGAAIYYSTTGKAPKLTDKNRYTGAFIITNTTTIYAVATRGEAMAYAVVTISKQELTLQYVLGDGGKIGVSTSPDFPWGPVADNRAAIGYSARSVLPTEDDMDSWVELSVMGAGTLSFKCRTSCEWDYTGGCEFDCLMAATNGVEIVGMRLDGIQDNWVDRAVTFSGDGEHKLRIIYHKDESDFDGEDCAWLGDVHWTPAGAADPIPAVTVDADAATVNATVDEVGFADAAVKEVIGGSAEGYNAFKTWADGVKGATGDALAGEAAVVANGHAAAAYLLGAERLFVNEPTVEIGEVSIAESEGAGTTAMTVAVTVKDGESAVAVSAAKVAAMFEATGDLGDWTGAAKLIPTVTPSGTDASGKMTFVVTPGDGTASKAFLRIRK